MSKVQTNLVPGGGVQIQVSPLSGSVSWLSWTAPILEIRCFKFCLQSIIKKIKNERENTWASFMVILDNPNNRD